jgi:outer membrane lipoprotein-sorting protein
VTANVKLTDHLLEGANLAGGDGEANQFSSNPLLSGASGRLWISKDGRVRLELQAEKGDTQVLYDGKALQLYDASANTLYRYTIPQHRSGSAQGSTDGGQATPDSGGQGDVPSVAKIEEAISHLSEHASISAATPTNVAGQPAYTVRATPKEGGSLFGGAELSWDAMHGVPLRAAVYSSTAGAPVLELAATEISYGSVDASVFDFTPPAGAKVHDLKVSEHSGTDTSQPAGQEHPKLTTRGHGITTIGVLEDKAREGSKESSSGLTDSLPKVKINGVDASELATPLGTLLSFERSGVSYLLAGSVGPGALEAVARGL